MDGFHMILVPLLNEQNIDIRAYKLWENVIYCLDNVWNILSMLTESIQ